MTASYFLLLTVDSCRFITGVRIAVFAFPDPACPTLHTILQAYPYPSKQEDHTLLMTARVMVSEVHTFLWFSPLLMGPCLICLTVSSAAVETRGNLFSLMVISFPLDVHPLLGYRVTR